MRVLRYLALLSILLFPAAYSSHAAVRIGIGVGVGGPVYAAPVCPYGYYGYYPYACAPYGYYGPRWFVNGVFIGAGPWYHPAWGPRPYYGYGYRGWGYGHPGYYRPGYYYHHDEYARGYAHGWYAHRR